MEVHLLATQGDCSLVQLDGRRFPGLLVQADSLKIFLEVLEEMIDLLSVRNLDDAEFAARDAINRTKAWISAYEEMMSERGLNLPYQASNKVDRNRGE